MKMHERYVEQGKEWFDGSDLTLEDLQHLKSSFELIFDTVNHAFDLDKEKDLDQSLRIVFWALKLVDQAQYGRLVIVNRMMKRDMLRLKLNFADGIQGAGIVHDTIAFYYNTLFEGGKGLLEPNSAETQVRYEFPATPPQQPPERRSWIAKRRQLLSDAAWIVAYLTIGVIVAGLTFAVIQSNKRWWFEAQPAPTSPSEGTADNPYLSRPLGP